MIHYLRYTLLFAALFFASVACCNIDDPDEHNITPPRTLLVYMVSSNLGGNMNNNLNQMKTQASNEALRYGNLIVFYSSVNADKSVSGRLYRIKEGKNGEIIEEEVKNYTNISAIDPDFMRSVVQEVMQRYPAKGYGMILSSHGTSWMPNNFNELRSFGEENSKRMEIYDLAEALQSFRFDFLSFDACSMGGVECAYELRNVADFILASPSEILVYGFPYENVLPYYFADKADIEEGLAAVAEGYNAFYQSYYHPYGNIALVKTSELGELAAVAGDIIKTAGAPQAMYDLQLSNVQVLSRFSGARTSLYDMQDLLNQLATNEQKAALQEALDAAVIRKYTTSQIIIQSSNFLTVNPEKYSGLSMYPLQENLPQHNAWYLENLAWAQKVYTLLYD